jgi:hypothetical protein
MQVLLNKFPIRRGSMWKFTDCMTIPLTSVYCKSVFCKGKNDGLVPVDTSAHDRIPQTQPSNAGAYLPRAESSN